MKLGKYTVPTVANKYNDIKKYEWYESDRYLKMTDMIHLNNGHMNIETTEKTCRDNDTSL